MIQLEAIVEAFNLQYLDTNYPTTKLAAYLHLRNSQLSAVAGVLLIVLSFFGILRSVTLFVIAFAVPAFYTYKAYCNSNLEQLREYSAYWMIFSLMQMGSQFLYRSIPLYYEFEVPSPVTQIVIVILLYCSKFRLADKLLSLIRKGMQSLNNNYFNLPPIINIKPK